MDERTSNITAEYPKKRTSGKHRPPPRSKKHGLPVLDFELESIKPIPRNTLNLDPRIFPRGIPPDSIAEIRGPSGSGKTFLMTYLLARLLATYPEKTAILVDTTLHFSLANLKSILSHLDPEITTNENEESSVKLKSQQKFLTYVNRISHLKCFTAPELLSKFGASMEIERMLLTEPNLSLIVIDSIDNYSYTPQVDPDGSYPNILKLIKATVENTKTPAICTITDYFPFPQIQPKNIPESPLTPTGKQNRWSLRQSNIILDQNLFTWSMVLNPRSVAPVMPMKSDGDQPGVSYLNEFLSTPKFECNANLSSRHSPKTAPFSGLSHRVKFSIFSGMLYPTPCPS